MGRRPISHPSLVQHQRDLAYLIDAELTRGQRADGTDPTAWRQWTNANFAATFKASASAVANWRNQVTLHPPDNIIPLLKTFYGDDPEFAAKRLAMQALWRRAKGFDTDDQSPEVAVLTPADRKNFQGPVRLVDLRAHSVPANDSTIRLPATLVVSPDDGVVFQGKAVSIGLTDAVLAFQSTSWQPAHMGMIGEKPHEHFRPIPQAARIVGPRDKFGRLDGVPLGEEPVAIIERIPNTEDGPVTLSVLAPQGGFDVRVRASPDAPIPAEQAVSPTKKIILDALFQEQLTNHDDRRAAILAQVTLNVPEKIG